MRVTWQFEVFGRQPGQTEEIDPAAEPRLETWLAAGLVVEGVEPSRRKKSKAKEDTDDGGTQAP